MAPAPEALDSLADDAAAALVEDGGPGVAIGIRARDCDDATACRGLADRVLGTPITASTAFCVASLTKPLTALATLIACARGELALDVPIASYVDAGPTDGSPTIRQLLTHTGGVANYVTNGAMPVLAALPHVTLDDVIASFADEPLEFEPGTRYGYSNSGYRLLEAALVRALDAPFAESLQQRVLALLGMRDARVLVGTDAPETLATGYDGANGPWVAARFGSWDLAGAAGALSCTLEDWLALDEALFERGTLPDAVLAPMIEPVRLAGGRAEAIGAGWVLGAYRGEPIATFAGGLPGYSSVYCRLLRTGASVTILSNRGGEELATTVRGVVDELLGTEPSPHPASDDAPDDGWATTYRDTLRAVELVCGADGWQLDDARAVRPLVPDGPTRLRDPDDNAFVVRLHDERPRAITVSWPFTWFTGYAA